MARPRSTLPDDVNAQRLYLGAVEREALHKLVERGWCSNLSMAARLLIQQGARAVASALLPGQHSVESETDDLQKVEVRLALDLRNATHLTCFTRLLETIELLDRETST